MKLTNETTALLSNALIAFGQDQDIQRQRLILSAVGAFDQYDKEVIKLLFERERAAKAKRMLEKAPDEKVPEWTIEDARRVVLDYFRDNPSKREIKFDLTEYLEFWLNKEVQKQDSKTNRQTSSYKNHTRAFRKIVESITGITYIRQAEDGALTAFGVFSTATLSGGLLTLQLSLDFLPYIIFYSDELRKIGYTKIELKSVRGNKSDNANRLFTILASEKNRLRKNEFKFEVSKLRERMGLAGKYPKYNDFKRYVLEPAIKDITKSSEIMREIKLEVTRTERRSPTEVQFTIKAAKKSKVNGDVDIKEGTVAKKLAKTCKPEVLSSDNQDPMDGYKEFLMQCGTEHELKNLQELEQIEGKNTTQGEG